MRHPLRGGSFDAENGEKPLERRRFDLSVVDTETRFVLQPAVHISTPTLDFSCVVKSSVCDMRP